MSNINLLIERLSPNHKASDFDLGRLEFILQGNKIPSNSSPKFHCMIYIALADLIDGINTLDKRKKFEYIAADSSFSMTFEKEKQGVFIAHEKNKHGPFGLKEIASAIDNGIKNFLSNHLNIPPTDGAAWQDLETRTQTLKHLLQ